MRWMIPALLLLASASSASAQHESERAFKVVRQPAGTIVDGDDGGRVAVYPCEGGALADSANRRVDAVWATGPKRWIVEVDTTMAYTFFYRTGCCSDTMAVELQCVPLVGPSFVPGAIEYADLELNAAVNNMIASRVDSGVVVPDTLSATVLRAYSELVVQPGNPQALFRVDDASARLRNIGLDIDNGDFVIDDGDIEQQSGGNFSTLGTITAGFSASDAHEITGILTINNDLFVTDDIDGNDLDIEALAIVQDSIRVGGDHGAADSTKSSTRLAGGHLEVSALSWEQGTIANGSLTATINFTGARTNDLVIPGPTITYAGDANSNIWGAKVVGNGKVTLTRQGTTGDLVVKVFLVKT